MNSNNNNNLIQWTQNQEIKKKNIFYEHFIGFIWITRKGGQRNKNPKETEHFENENKSRRKKDKQKNVLQEKENNLHTQQIFYYHLQFSSESGLLCT